MHGGGGLPPGGGCIAELGVSCAESTTSEFARALVVRSPHPDTPSTPLARLLRACSPAPRKYQRRMRKPAVKEHYITAGIFLLGFVIFVKFAASFLVRFK